MQNYLQHVEANNFTLPMSDSPSVKIGVGNSYIYNVDLPSPPFSKKSSQNTICVSSDDCKSFADYCSIEHVKHNGAFEGIVLACFALSAAALFPVIRTSLVASIDHRHLKQRLYRVIKKQKANEKLWITELLNKTLLKSIKKRTIDHVWCWARGIERVVIISGILCFLGSLSFLLFGLCKNFHIACLFFLTPFIITVLGSWFLSYRITKFIDTEWTEQAKMLENQNKNGERNSVLQDAQNEFLD